MNEQTKNTQDEIMRTSIEQDHEEAMRIYSLVHNGVLLVVWLILLFTVTHWLLFTIIFLCLWDWSYKK